MNLAKGTLGGLQKAKAGSLFNFGGWFRHVIRRNVLAGGAEAERNKRDAVTKTCYQYRLYD